MVPPVDTGVLRAGRLPDAAAHGYDARERRRAQADADTDGLPRRLRQPGPGRVTSRNQQPPRRAIVFIMPLLFARYTVVDRPHVPITPKVPTTWLTHVVTLVYSSL